MKGSVLFVAWYNYDRINSYNATLNFILTNRGFGKTFGAKCNVIKKFIKKGEQFVYVRRYKTELNDIHKFFDSPDLRKKFKTHTFEVKGKTFYIDGKIAGYAIALSTSQKLKSVDYPFVTTIIFDEFINTSPVNSLKGESGLLFNLIETINRNRELEDKEAVKVVLLSNSNTIDDDIIRVLSLGDQIQQMKTNNEHLYIDSERGIYLSLLENKTVKDMKLKTKLYKLTKGTSFYDMAIENEFTKDYFGDLKKINYQELQPVVNYESVYFYKHKSKDIMLASHRKANCDKYNERTKQAFKRNYGYMFAYYIETGLMFYTDYNVKLEVKNIF